MNKRMRREVIHDSSTNETSSSIGTLDSIKAAFDSLDAASVSDQQHHQQHSSQSKHDSVENQNRTLLRALPRQQFTDDEYVNTNDKSFRPLCGGPSKGEMLKRAKETVRIDGEKSIGDVQTPELSSDFDRMQPLSDSVLNSPQAYNGVSKSSDVLQEPFQIIPTSRVSDSSSNANQTIPIDSVVHTGSNENSPQKKRNLLWAAKRDRRNARRRPSPPLTRRRAAALADSTTKDAIVETENRVEEAQDGMDLSKSFPSMAQVSIDITDPSNSDRTIQDTLKHSVITKKVRKNIQSHPRTALPQLDMTLTDRDLPLQYGQGSHCEDRIHKDACAEDRGAQIGNHEQASDTETEDERDESRPMTVPAFSSGSNTEDEQEITSKEPQPNKPKSLIKSAIARSSEKKKIVRPKRTSLPRKRKGMKKVALEREEEILRAQRKQEQKKNSSKMQKRNPKEIPKGRPLFEGLSVVIIGFWANVEKYTKLIEKHGGRKVKTNETTLSSGAPFVPLLPQFDHSHLPDAISEDRITHIIYCPHGTYIPDPDIVREAILQWKKESGRNLRLQDIEIVDSRWITECISKCLRKEDLLSVRDYRIVI